MINKKYRIYGVKLFQVGLSCPNSTSKFRRQLYFSLKIFSKIMIKILNDLLLDSHEPVSSIKNFSKLKLINAAINYIQNTSF